MLFVSSLLCLWDLTIRDAFRFKWVKGFNLGIEMLFVSREMHDLDSGDESALSKTRFNLGIEMLFVSRG